MFGAFGSGSTADVWVLDTSPGSESWSRMIPTGTAPAAGNPVSVVLDAVNYQAP